MAPWSQDCLRCGHGPVPWSHAHDACNRQAGAGKVRRCRCIGREHFDASRAARHDVVPRPEALERRRGQGCKMQQPATIHRGAWPAACSQREPLCCTPVVWHTSTRSATPGRGRPIKLCTYRDASLLHASFYAYLTCGASLHGTSTYGVSNFLSTRDELVPLAVAWVGFPWIRRGLGSMSRSPTPIPTGHSSDDGTCNWAATVSCMCPTFDSSCLKRRPGQPYWYHCTCADLTLPLGRAPIGDFHCKHAPR